MSRDTSAVQTWVSRNRAHLRGVFGAIPLSIPTGTAARRWSGPCLLLARGLWILIAALATGLFVAGAWVSYGVYQTVCTTAPCPEYQLTNDDVPALHALGLSLDFYAAYSVALDASFALVYGAVAAVIFWRKAADGLALFVSIALLTFGLAGFPPTLEVLAVIYPAWRLPVAGLGLLASVAFGLFLYVFPDGRFVPRWTLWVALLWIAWRILNLELANWDAKQEGWYSGLSIVMIVGTLGAAVYSQVYRYRHVSNAARRQQTKWVMLGISVALIGYIGVTVPLSLMIATPVSAGEMATLFVGYTLIDLAMLLIPVSIGIAILRYHLFDIDVLINRALVYGTLTVGLAAVYEISALLLGSLLQPVTGGSGLAIASTTLVVAALVRPAQSRIQRTVDRRFYRRKYDAARTIQLFSSRLRDEIDLDAVTHELRCVIQETMQPVHNSLWLRPSDRDAPRGEPPTRPQP